MARNTQYIYLDDVLETSLFRKSDRSIAAKLAVTANGTAFVKLVRMSAIRATRSR
jgi:hypothetical protein